MFYMDINLIGRRGAMLTGFGLVSAASLLAIAVKGDEHSFIAANIVIKMCISAPSTLLFVCESKNKNAM